MEWQKMDPLLGSGTVQFAKWRQACDQPFDFGILKTACFQTPHYHIDLLMQHVQLIP